MCLTCTVHQVHVVRMTLDEFMKLRGLKAADIAGHLGVHRSYLSRIRRGLAVPSPKQMKAVFAFTEGAVTPNDFVLQRSPEPEVSA